MPEFAARGRRQVLDWRVVAGGDEIVGETARVRLRRLRASDIDAVAAMVADPEQMRFYPHPKSRAEVVAWLEWNLALYEESGFGTWYLESVGDRRVRRVLRDSPAPA